MWSRSVAGRSERTARLAREAGLDLLPDVAEVVAAADVVLSIVPPGRAEAVATELAWRRLLADLNAVSPETVKRIGARRRRLDLGAAAATGGGDHGSTCRAARRRGGRAALRRRRSGRRRRRDRGGVGGEDEHRVGVQGLGRTASPGPPGRRPLRRSRPRARRPRRPRGRRGSQDLEGGGKGGALRRRDD